MLTDNEKRGVLTVALLASFVDGGKSDQERQTIKDVTEGLGVEGAVNPSAVLADVMLRRVDIAGAAGLLESPESRQLAYEVAVQVCDADGLRNAEETAFLQRLAVGLGITRDEAESAERPADDLAATLEPGALASVGVAGAGVAGAVGLAGGALPSNVPVAAGVPAVAPAAGVNVDGTIRNYAILCGALELLPQSLAGMAVVPMQVKMVYEIARAHGHTPGTEHIKDFIATLGVGLTSQYFEGFARKLLGGFLKKFGGKFAGKAGKAGASVVMSFATTYAMGQVANQYYASGRRMSTDILRNAYQSSLSQAQSLQGQFMPAMEQKAAGLDYMKVLDMVRGKAPVV